MKKQSDDSQPSQQAVEPEIQQIVIQHRWYEKTLVMLPLPMMLFGMIGLLFLPEYEPAVQPCPLARAVALSFLSLMCILIALGIAYTFRYKAVITPTNLAVTTTWKTTSISAHEIERIKWKCPGTIVVFGNNTKVTIETSLLSKSDKDQALRLLTLNFADKPQEDRDKIIALEANQERWKLLKVPIAIPVAIIGLFTGGTAWAYAAHRHPIFLAGAIISLLTLLYVVWSEVNSRKKASDQKQADQNQDEV